MLAQHHPSQPVAAEKHDRAEADGEVPVGVGRGEPGKERAQVVTRDRADGLTRGSRHRRECGRHNRGEPEEWRRDRSCDARGTRLSEQRRLDHRRDRHHDGTATAAARAQPARRQHRPCRRRDQPDAEDRGDLEVVVALCPLYLRGSRGAGSRGRRRRPCGQPVAEVRSPDPSTSPRRTTHQSRARRQAAGMRSA